MTNFHPKHTTKKGTYMPDREQSPKHTAKTPSHRTGIFATLRALLRGKGTSAPSSRPLRATLAILALALVALFATVVPASASEVKPVTEISYDSAQLNGTVTATGPAIWSFEYSTDETNWNSGPGGFFFSPGEYPVEPKKDNLKSGTKYFIRLVVGGSKFPTTAPYTSFTTLVADPPSVEATDNAAEVEYTTASVSGKVNRPEKSNNLTCNFEYITDAQFTANQGASNPGFEGATPVACEPSPVETVGSSTVNAKLTGLANDTTYHLRLAVSGAGGTDAKEAAATFKTLKVDPPSVKSIEDATEVEYTTAQVKGVVERPATSEDPAFDISSCNFEAVSDQLFDSNSPEDKFAGAVAVACEAPEFPIHAGGKTDVEATLTGLAAATEYHLRLSASNLGGSDAKVAAATFTTLAVDPPSVLAIENATGIDQDSATVKGEISRPDNPDPAFDVNCRFQYVTDEQFKATGFANPGEALCEPKAEPAENPIHTAGPSEVTGKLTGLENETTYHLRLFASNPGGSDDKEAAATFTTTQNLPPSAVVGPITEITGGGATLNGEVDPDEGFFYSYPYFELSTDQVSWTDFPAGITAAVKLTPVGPLVITGLRGATKYFVRLNLLDQDREVKGNQLAISQPPYPSFTTLPVDPGVVLKANDATDVTAETAKVSGEIERPANPEPAADTNCRFEYVTDAQFQANGYQKALQTPCGIEPLATPGEKKEVEAELTDLKSGTEYHVRLTATNAGPDASLEAANTFTTVAVPVTASQTAGASDGKAGYVLSGLVNPRNSTISKCEFVYGPDSDLDYKKYAFAVPCSPTPDAVNKSVSVEGHVTGLTPDNEYHSRLVVTNAFGTVVTPDQGFVPTLDVGQNCPNEALRKENSSEALPECRAYEQVTSPEKSGLPANLRDFSADGDTVSYQSRASNIANSGQGAQAGNNYVSVRGNSGWKTIANLNGPSGSLFSFPDGFVNLRPVYVSAYSPDFRSSVLLGSKLSEPTAGGFFDDPADLYLRHPDGSVTKIGNGTPSKDSPYYPGSGHIYETTVGASDDLSHLLVNGKPKRGGSGQVWGPGVYEFLGIGNDQPRRVDLFNSGDPVAECGAGAARNLSSAYGNSISDDGRVIVVTVLPCGANPPAQEIWARIGGTTSFDVSASQCIRSDCNAPSDATFQGAAEDGSRVFFTTTQQLVDGDTDQTDDLYACDLPSGTPTPTGEANPCSALIGVSGAQNGAEVETLSGVSDDGSTVLFTAKGVLADSEDSLGDKAVAGDHNLYLWRSEAAHPDGVTTFLGRLDSVLDGGGSPDPKAQATSDGHYLVFTTQSQLVPTDTDTARDVYRYDADTATVTRVSVGTSGASGNAEGFDASILRETVHESHPALAEDGSVVFSTAEPLSPLDGNGEFDVYLWRAGHVHLISTGAAGSGTGVLGAAISASGRDVYFSTSAQLSPSDLDIVGDVYDARIEGGFRFSPTPPCSGEPCLPPAPNPPTPPAPETAKPGGEGNVKACPKGKVRSKKGKCVKKHTKGQKHKKSHKRAGHNRGGSK